MTTKIHAIVTIACLPWFTTVFVNAVINVFTPPFVWTFESGPLFRLRLWKLRTAFRPKAAPQREIGF